MYLNINIIVSNLRGIQQTVNVTGVREDRYFVITGDKDEANYIVEDQTADMETGTHASEGRNLKAGNDEAMYDMSGCELPKGQKSHGIIIKNGQWVLFK